MALFTVTGSHAANISEAFEISLDESIANSRERTWRILRGSRQLHSTKISTSSLVGVHGIHPMKRTPHVDCRLSLNVIGINQYPLVYIRDKRPLRDA